MRYSQPAAGFVVIAILAVCSDRAGAVDLSDADCIIEPHVSVDLGTSVDGIVDEILVDRGDTVAEGQVLVRLESGVERAAVKQAQLRTRQKSGTELAEGRLVFAKRKRDRTMQLFADNVVSEMTRDEVDLEVETAELELKRATENEEQAQLDLERAQAILDLRRIVSPIDGIVVERLVSPGESIGQQQTVLMKLVQVDPLNVELIVPSSQFGSFVLGGTLLISPRPPGKGTYEATIDIIDPVIDAASGTFGVRAKLPNPGHRIPAGLVCTAALASN